MCGGRMGVGDGGSGGGLSTAQSQRNVFKFELFVNDELVNKVRKDNKKKVCLHQTNTASRD